ncbi:MAG: TlpA family protein disulfide reductase [Planctomycetes bacterium]|nr:TlpA family protein disulfide reductase [Planctomycetota bacterium]
MKPLAIVSVAVLSLATLLSLRATSADKPLVGAVPPEIDAAGWINHVGPAPTLASLKGQTVLIEFWATWCAPCVAAWPHLQELHDEYESRGLVILGLSEEAADKVSPFVNENGYTARIAYGSTTKGKYGVNGIPATFLVGPDGKLAWSGHPSELNDSVLEAALKGAKPRAGGILGFAPATAAEGRVAQQVKLVEEGKLGKALAALTAFAQDTTASDGEKAAAAALTVEIEGYVAALMSQSERHLKSLNVLRAVNTYESIAKEFGAAQLGADAKSKLDAIKADEKLSRELAAAEAFQKTKDSAAKLKGAKARDKWAEFAQKYKGTRAAERATALARAPKN